MEIIKAMLMKFVYDHGGAAKVEQIQSEFGKIYGMEERLGAHSFRGEMTMEQLFGLHLRVVDDGTKRAEKDFHSPATNAKSEALVAYVDSRLHFEDGDNTKAKKAPADGVQYALNLANEFKKSVQIVSETLPAWDAKDPLVGDVLILEPDLSCQFFLIVCRCLEREKNKADGHIGNDSLLLWEKLLFTRDFHGKYDGLWYRDNFPKLFELCVKNEKQISDLLKKYLAEGFRPERTKGLQSIVIQYLNDNSPNVLNHAFHWWTDKMKYAIYKYEKSNGAEIRDVMKGKISVEHILPQDWQWKWIEGTSQVPGKLSDDEKEKWQKEVGTFINGIGNLLLVTPGENSSASNKHPAEKQYKCTGGSYKEHNENRELWNQPKQWDKLIHKRGEKIFKFMLDRLVGTSHETKTEIQAAEV